MIQRNKYSKLNSTLKLRVAFFGQEYILILKILSSHISIFFLSLILNLKITNK